MLGGGASGAHRHLVLTDAAIVRRQKMDCPQTSRGEDIPAEALLSPLGLAHMRRRPSLLRISADSFTVAFIHARRDKGTL